MTDPIAYCAPGNRLMAALTLVMEDERFCEIVETQFVGGSEVILAYEPYFEDVLALPTKLFEMDYSYAVPRTYPPQAVWQTHAWISGTL